MRRRIAHFFVLGALLFAAKTGYARLAPRPRTTLEVVVPRDADARTRAALVDEAILLEEAIRFGWVTTDPIVQRRLAVNMALASGADVPSSDADIDREAVARAIALGMYRTDPVARSRLTSRVRQRLEAPDPDAPPDDAALEAHLRRHSARFARPTRITFVHLVFRNDLRGENAIADAGAALARLRRGEVTDADARALGDASPLLAPRQSSSVIATDRLFGRGFGTITATLAAEVWSGPIASSYGQHLVKVFETQAERVPPLSRIRARVLGDYVISTRGERASLRLEALRARYDIRIVETGRAP